MNTSKLHSFLNVFSFPRPKEVLQFVAWLLLVARRKKAGIVSELKGQRWFKLELMPSKTLTLVLFRCADCQIIPSCRLHSVTLPF